jgi:hypothetical protein
MAMVWASNAMINPAMLRPISNCFDDGSEKGRELYTKGYRGNLAGESLPAEYFPPEIYVRKDADRNYEKLPELFFAGSYWVVSGEVADVMRKFDLGFCNLYPTKVFRKDRKTPIGDRWFCLNFGNVKRAYREGGSDSTYWIPKPETRHGAPITLRDNLLVVSNESLIGPDIWVDPQIRDIFFLSDPLAQALKAAGVARAFGLKKCRVIPG